MSKHTPSFPDSLMIRDTGIYDDLGGLGQRIYTTAGSGYEKRKYVRADSHDELTTALASERMHKGALISRIAELEKALSNLLCMLPSADESQSGRIPQGFCYVRWQDINEGRTALKVKP